MDIPINAQLKINTQEASQSLQDLGKTMVLPPSQGPQLLGAGGPLNAVNPLSSQSFQLYNNLNMNMRTFTDQLTKVIDKFKALEGSVENINSGSGAGTGSSNDLFFSKLFNRNQNVPQGVGQNSSLSMITSIAGIASGAYQGAQGYYGSLATGDYMGASANAIGTFGGVLSGLAGPAMFINPYLGAGLLLAGTAMNAVSSHKQLQKTKHDVSFNELGNYQNMLNYYGAENAGSLDVAMSGYGVSHREGNNIVQGSGGLYDKSYDLGGNLDYTTDVNTARANQLWNRAWDKNSKGYLDFDTYNSIILQQRKNGVNSIDQASDIASQIGKYAYGTGMDANTLASNMGIITRYGGGNADTLSTLYKSAMASNLDRSQFDEFMQGIAQAMQDGLSKGFVNSADKIAENLVTISQLGQGAQDWIGTQGASRASAVSGAMQNAVNLSDTNSMVMYQSAKQYLEANSNGQPVEYYDVMAFLQKGEFGNGYLSIYDKNLSNYYGDDKASKIEAYRKLANGDYSSAMKMMNNIGNVVPTDLSAQKDIEIADSILALENRTQNETKIKTVTEGLHAGFFDIVNGAKASGIDVLDGWSGGYYNNFLPLAKVLRNSDFRETPLFSDNANKDAFDVLYNQGEVKSVPADDSIRNSINTLINAINDSGIKQDKVLEALQNVLNGEITIKYDN